MRVKLITKDGTRMCSASFDHALSEGTCPKCRRAEPNGGFKVGGSGKHPSADDRAWEAEAYCLECKAHVGVLRVETNTLFGVREDAEVLSGKYGTVL